MIRPFLEADTSDVVARWCEVFAYSAPHNEPEAVIKHKLSVQRELFFVARLDGVLVGTVMGAMLATGVGSTPSLCVSPPVGGACARRS